MPSILQRLGLDPGTVRSAAEASHKAKCARQVTDVLTGKAAPTKTERDVVHTRKTKTHYLDGEEQRRIKARLAADHAFILGLVLQGYSVSLIATIYGVTDMCIYKRASPVLEAIRDAEAQREAPTPAAMPDASGNALVQAEQAPAEGVRELGA